MLRVVGHPVAVNPDAALQRIAREEGWRIMRFDKLGRRIKLAGAAGGWCSWPAAEGSWLRGCAGRGGFRCCAANRAEPDSRNTAPSKLHKTCMPPAVRLTRP